MTWTGRDPQLTEPMPVTNGYRQGSVSGARVRGLERAPRRGPWRGLVFLVVLYFVVRVILRLVRMFFDAVGDGSVTLARFDPNWADPTYKIVRLGVIAFALVVAYPYIPGSGSAAFSGILSKKRKGTAWNALENGSQEPLPTDWRSNSISRQRDGTSVRRCASQSSAVNRPIE